MEHKISAKTTNPANFSQCFVPNVSPINKIGRFLKAYLKFIEVAGANTLRKTNAWTSVPQQLSCKS